MADYTVNGLNAAAKSLIDVVAPSIDPTDPLAKEQLKLVVDYLHFLRDRVDFIQLRQRFHCQHQHRMAEELIGHADQVSTVLAGELKLAISLSTQLLDDPSASAVSLRELTAILANRVSRLVNEAVKQNSPAATDIREIVLRRSKDVIDFERTWYLPFGFDSKPDSLQTLESYFGK